MMPGGLSLRMSGKISIIIPVYNHVDALERALLSIGDQSYKNVEIIVVDDGSDMPVQADGVRIIRQKNAGAPAARNRGLKEATGEHVIFWDADVTADPTFLEKMVAVLKKDETASFVYTNMRYGDRLMPARPFNVDALKRNNYIHSTSLVRKRDAVQWDESLKRFQDWD